MHQIRGKQQGVQKWHPLKGNRVKAKLSRIYIKGGIFAYWWLPKNPVYFSICHIPYWHVSIAITGLMIDWCIEPQTNNHQTSEYHNQSNFIRIMKKFKSSFVWMHVSFVFTDSWTLLNLEFDDYTDICIVKSMFDIYL